MHVAYLIIGLLVLVCLLPQLARHLRLPAPIVLFVFGAIIGMVPQIPTIHMPPEIIMPLFLPPLLMAAAYATSWRDFRRALRPILLLAIGLVVITTVAVGAVASWLAPGMSLAVGLVLGAIVSPPDAVAATSVFQSLRVPRRILTILEGESLVNDATGLVLYQLTIAAVVSGMMSPVMIAGDFMWKVVGGLGIGAGLGWVSMWAFPRLCDRRAQILFTFLIPYVAYVLAENVHASGVLSVVAGGLVVGWMAPSIFSPGFRGPVEAVWETTVHMFNSLAFLLVGLEAYDTMERVRDEYSWSELFWLALACAVVMVAVRLLWVFSFTYGLRYFSPRLRDRESAPAWQNVFLIGWSGMRGVVSLATALAVPLTLADGTDFPERDLLLFLASALIFFSLVVQGSTLPWLLRKLALTYDANLLFEDWQARHTATKEAIQIIESLCGQDGLHEPALMRIHSYYQDRLEALGDGPNTPLQPSEEGILYEHPVLQAERNLWSQVLTAERNAVLSLRRSWKIGDDVMHDLLREIDMNSQRFTPKGAVA